jgi:putative endonuclease
VAETNGLLNRHTPIRGIEGSNPSLSAFYVYIIKSLSAKKFYIGHSANPFNRLIDHNSGKVKFTKRFIPWEIVHLESFDSKSDAYKRELKIKSYKGGNAFKKLINNSSG